MTISSKCSHYISIFPYTASQAILTPILGIYTIQSYYALLNNPLSQGSSITMSEGSDTQVSYVTKVQMKVKIAGNLSAFH